MTQEQEKALNVVQKIMDNISSYPITSEDIITLIKGILSNEENVSHPIFIPNNTPSNPPSYIPGEVYCELEAVPSKIISEKEMIEKSKAERDKDPNQYLLEIPIKPLYNPSGMGTAQPTISGSYNVQEYVR